MDKQELKLQYFRSGIKQNKSLIKVQSTPDIAPLFVHRSWSRVALYRGYSTLWMMKQWKGEKDVWREKERKKADALAKSEVLTLNN